jgi:hypothetical protein
MIQRNLSRQYGQPLFIDRLDTMGTARVLERVTLSAAPGNDSNITYSEGWLQGLIHRFPQTLPIDEIEPGLAGALAVCMELPTPAGPVDNLFATARGDLVLTECKLWRNPQARREVVGQIIDYAHAMAAWSYQDLEAAIAGAITPGGEPPSGSLYEIVGGDEETDEAVFADAVSRNLRLGRMLLLIVGDGIREGVETIADYLQLHAGFHFTLGLVEYAVHRMPGDVSFIVQPRVLARTVNIERAIVRIEEGRPVVTGVPVAGSAGRGRRTSITEEHLRESLAARDPALPERLRSFLDRAGEYRVTSELSGSLMLKWQDCRGNKFNLGCVYPNGEVSTEPVSFTANFTGRVDLAHHYLERLASSIKGIVRRPRTENPAHWYVTADGKKLPLISQLLEVSEEWLAAIDDYTVQLEQAALAKEAPPEE